MSAIYPALTSHWFIIHLTKSEHALNFNKDDKYGITKKNLQVKSNAIFKKALNMFKLQLNRIIKG